MTPVQEGQVLAGKYRVERVLGVGGMGVVVSALHIQLDERVALKFLLPEALSNSEAVARFAREARAAVKIKSVHVARVSDVGTLETGAPYMVMEFLQGQDLAALLRDRGPVPYPDAVDFVLQAGEAIAEAHALGIVHRDLKPANLFMIIAADGAPCIKVLDFGISKITSPGSSDPDYGMTKTQAVMGSPLYMSPEQMTSSRAVDGRSDIWAVGTILYELVCGRPPFLGETMPQLCGMILQEAPPPPRQFRPELPEGLEAAILRCLEKDRNRRFANVGELAAALAPFGSRHAARSAERISKVLSTAGISSTELDIHPAPPGPAAAATQSNFGNTTATKRSGRTLLIALAVLGAAAAGVVALFLRQPADGNASGAPSSPTATPAPPPAQGPATAPPSAEPTAPTPPVEPSPMATAASATATPTAAPAPKPGLRPRPTVKPAKPAKPTPTPTPSPTPSPAPRPAIDPLEGRR
jgi:eukaryotic-like serine/threonine-protein kinase